MDGHFAPQALLGAFDRLQYGFIGRFETFEQDMGALVEVEVAQLEVPEDVWRTQTAHSTGARATLADHHADGRCVDLVRTIHRRDFELLGYGRDPRSA